MWLTFSIAVNKCNSQCTLQHSLNKNNVSEKCCLQVTICLEDKMFPFNKKHHSCKKRVHVGGLENTSLPNKRQTTHSSLWRSNYGIPLPVTPLGSQTQLAAAIAMRPYLGEHVAAIGCHYRSRHEHEHFLYLCSHWKHECFWKKVSLIKQPSHIESY